MGAAQEAPEEVPATEGSYRVFVSSRIFDEPLFGSRLTGTYRLFGTQTLAGQGNLTAWLDAGFPNYQTDWGVEADQVPGLGGVMRLGLGDFLLQPLLPSVFQVTTRDTYPLQGVAASLVRGRDQVAMFAGRAKWFRALPGRDTPRPTLYGGRWLRAFGRDYLGLSVTVVEDPTFVSPERVEDATGVLGIEYNRLVSPWVGLRAELLAAEDGFGGRFGTRARFQRAQLAAYLYAFDDGFPFVDPLYRPGEYGLEVSGNTQLGEFTTLAGFVDFARDTQVDLTEDVRGELGLGWSLGSNRPQLYLAYSRNEITFDSLSIAGKGSTADRFSLTATQSSVSQFATLRIEHVMASADGIPERSQAVLGLRRQLRGESFLTGSLLVQREADSDVGVTAETAIEQPIRRRWFYLLGIGAAYVDRGKAVGEGVLRIGVAHRVLGNGWTGRLEAAIPFGIGLDRSGLTSRQVVFDIGHRFSWSSLEALRSVLAPSSSAGDYGRIEGTVIHDGKGVGRVTVYVNGEARATTSSDGALAVPRVPVGSATVRLDLREFDPRFTVVGGASRQVDVLPRGVSDVEFELVETSYLQGSLVVCDGGRTRALGDVELTLICDGYRRTMRTSRVGGYVFDEIPPGPCTLELAAPQRALPPGVAGPTRWELDLTGDLPGHLIRVGCPAESVGPLTSGGRLDEEQ